MKLDKFYTSRTAAKECFDFLQENIAPSQEALYLEPSAGGGVFLEFLNNYIALDIAPEDERITKQNFLNYSSPIKNFITIGNPPFGKRSKLAIDFFNKAAKMSEVIAFIVPVSFMKWNVQKELDSNFCLKAYFYLPSNSFVVNGEEYSIRTIFQVWIKKDSQYDNGVNLRLQRQPPISHSDFQIWQYNATPAAEKVVEEDWKYATYRQGYHDYNQLFTRNSYGYIKEHMTGGRKQQFFFIKPLSIEAESIILSMDFNSLAERNTATPGFGKGDFVSYYTELKKAREEQT